MRYFLPKNQGKVSNIDRQRLDTERPNSTSEGTGQLKELLAVVGDRVVPSTGLSVPRKHPISFDSLSPGSQDLQEGRGGGGGGVGVETGLARSQSGGRGWLGKGVALLKDGRGREATTRGAGERKLGQLQVWE